MKRIKAKLFLGNGIIKVSQFVKTKIKMKEKTPLVILVCLISFGALANLMRLFWDIPVTIGTFTLPGWTGAIFFLVLGLLAAWSFRALFSGYRASPSVHDKAEEPRPPSA